MLALQNLIHHLEEGKGTHYLKGVAGLLIFCFIALLYDHRSYENFHTQEAMETAQLARNIANGEGYTTRMIRPFDIYLLDQKQPKEALQMTTRHPDLANPPLYPAVLAGLMKVGTWIKGVPYLGRLNFNYTLNPERFMRFQPEVLITIFNQLLFLSSVFLLFFLARRLFDSGVAWLAAIIFAGTELFWRASTSGLAIHLLIFLLLLLLHLLVRLEQNNLPPAPESTDPSAPVWKSLLLVAGAGLLAAGIFLTRYSLGSCVALATFIWLVAGWNRRWLVQAGIFAVIFLAAAAPWMMRNQRLTGHWFGSAGYALHQSSGPGTSFPGTTLERSLDPSAPLKTAGFRSHLRKLVFHGREVLQQQLPNFCGSWLGAFFVGALLVPFRNPVLRRFRWFVVLLILFASIFQPLGRTHLWDDKPWVNSENLLLVAGVPTFILGAAMFFILMEQFEWFLLRFRLSTLSVFAVICLLPLGATLLPPKTVPIIYPPYNPPLIHRISEWMGKQDLMMSDMPWAVAWYGNRPCLWLTLNSKSEFFAIHDYRQSVRALYLTPISFGMPLRPYLQQEFVGEDAGWGWFVLHAGVGKELPKGFPLKKAPGRFLPEQLFLTDKERWLKPSDSEGTN